MTFPDRDWSCLAALVAPVAAPQFLERHWTAHHLLCRGARNRYAHLLSWNELNGLLEHHWREMYRFRLARRGRDLDPASYADLDGSTTRIRPKDFTDHLRCGATLSFDAIDELHPPLRRLAESFEAMFCGSTQINTYAGWRAMHGLDLHRDDQEVFILQLDGRKRWLLYGFSVDGIDRQELERRSTPPAGAELDEILEPGDLLYVPRGCYHVALPMDEPTLHLTIGIRLPQSGSTSNLKPRPSFSLPFSATAQGLPSGSDFIVRLNAPAPMAVDGAGATATEWRAGARSFCFPRSMGVIIGRLSNGGSWSLSQLLDAVSGDLDEASLRLLLGMLVRQHLVAIRSEPEHPA